MEDKKIMDKNLPQKRPIVERCPECGNPHIDDMGEGRYICMGCGWDSDDD